MIVGIFILLLILIAGAIAFYYYRNHGSLVRSGYMEHSISLRTSQDERDTKELTEAQEIINCVKNRRESISSRRGSFEEATGEFVNLKNLKLSRAMSCESVMSETSDLDTYEQDQNEGSTRIDRIPDIKTWLKNPTDFIKFPPNRNLDDPLSGPQDDVDKSSEEKKETLPQLMISMSYLPTAERLSVVIVRLRVPAHRLMTTDPDEMSSSSYLPQMVYIKAYLVDNKSGKRNCKKKTSFKQLESQTGQLASTINFNELMIFKLPINQLQFTSIRISVTGIGVAASASSVASVANPLQLNDGQSDDRILSSLGNVTIGSTASCSPEAVSHFTSMITTMRKPVTMWHTLQAQQTN